MNKMKCPCCGYYTISEIFEICKVCFWQYDEVAHDRPDEYVGGANNLSLTEARNNYLNFGVSEFKFIDSVRLPINDELPENNE